MRDYRGGLEDWVASGGKLVNAALPVSPAEPPQYAPAAPARTETRALRHQWGNGVLDLVECRSTGQLFVVWLAMIVLCGAIYWATGVLTGQGLIENGDSIGTGLAGLLSAIYFSFVTATSVGYGDVVPVGGVRVVAVVEAVSGLLIFGAVVAKFVSRRQDELVREIHSVTFEERLDRVQTNLHLVLSELQSIASLCDSGTAMPLHRLATRFDSAVLVFASELRAVHDLLYRPRHAPPEPILGAILATLAAALNALSDLLACLPKEFSRSPTLEHALQNLSSLADEICAQCVPQVYAPALGEKMDRIQQMARKIR